MLSDTFALEADVILVTRHPLSRATCILAQCSKQQVAPMLKLAVALFVASTVGVAQGAALRRAPQPHAPQFDLRFHAN